MLSLTKTQKSTSGWLFSLSAIFHLALSSIAVPSQVDLVPSFCLESLQLWEKPADVIRPPIPPGPFGLQSLLRMPYEWRGGGEIVKCSFCAETWGTGFEEGVLSFFSFHFFPFFSFSLFSFAPSVPERNVIHHPPLRSVALDVRSTVTPDPSTCPLLSFLRHLCFYSTLTAVFKTHIVMCKNENKKIMMLITKIWIILYLKLWWG